MELLAFGKTGWGDELFIATLMTVAVSITAMFIGFLFALIFTPLKLSKNKFFNLIGNSYTTVIRGVPELLVIYLFFFGGSGAVMYVASIFGYNEYIEINAFITGSCAIGIISGAYSTEVFRGALQSIDRGQYEASNCPLSIDCIAPLKTSVEYAPDIIPIANEPVINALISIYSLYPKIDATYITAPLPPKKNK